MLVHQPLTRDEEGAAGVRLIRAVFSTVLAVTLFSCSTAAPPATNRPGHSESLLTLTDIAAHRVQLADTVAAAKWGTNTGINDPEREKAVLDTCSRQVNAARHRSGGLSGGFHRSDRGEQSRPIRTPLTVARAPGPGAHHPARSGADPADPGPNHRSAARRAEGDAAAPSRALLYRRADRSTPPRRTHPAPRSPARRRPRPRAHLNLLLALQPHFHSE